MRITGRVQRGNEPDIPGGGGQGARAGWLERQDDAGIAARGPA